MKNTTEQDFNELEDMNREEETKMFAEWLGWENIEGSKLDFGLAMWYDKNSKVLYRKTWNPRENIADAFMLLDKFDNYNIQYDDNNVMPPSIKYAVSVISINNKSSYAGLGKTPQDAICEAVKRYIKECELK